MNAIAELDNFTEIETSGLTDEMKVKLQALRYEVGVPMYITSGVRPGGTSAHGLGLAVDISDNGNSDDISSIWRFKVLRAAFAMGFRRVGIYDKHIHLDISKSHDQDVCWYGVSD